MDPTSCSVVFGFGVTWTNTIFFFCLSGYVLIYMHHQELIMSEGSDGSQSQLFWIRVTVWFLVSDTHKVMTATHSCCISFGFSGTDTTFIFNVLLWSFLYNLIDIVSSLPCMEAHLGISLGWPISESAPAWRDWQSSEEGICLSLSFWLRLAIRNVHQCAFHWNQFSPGKTKECTCLDQWVICCWFMCSTLSYEELF